MLESASGRQGIAKRFIEAGTPVTKAQTNSSYITVSRCTPPTRTPYKPMWLITSILGIVTARIQPMPPKVPQPNSSKGVFPLRIRVGTSNAVTLWSPIAGVVLLKRVPSLMIDHTSLAGSRIACVHITRAKTAATTGNNTFIRHCCQQSSDCIPKLTNKKDNFVVCMSERKLLYKNTLTYDNPPK